MNTQEAEQLTNRCVQLATEYGKERVASMTARVDFEILLTADLAELRKDKPNAGFDTLCLMFIEKDPLAKELYSTWKKKEARYKGLERLLEATHTKISYMQSVMKYNSNGEKRGY